MTEFKIKPVVLRFGVGACVTRRHWRKYGRLFIVQDLSGDWFSHVCPLQGSTKDNSSWFLAVTLLIFKNFVTAYCSKKNFFFNCMQK